MRMRLHVHSPREVCVVTLLVVVVASLKSSTTGSTVSGSVITNPYATKVVRVNSYLHEYECEFEHAHACCHEGDPDLKHYRTSFLNSSVVAVRIRA